MRSKSFLTCIFLSLATAPVPMAIARTSESKSTREQLARQAVSDDRAKSETAIAALRQEGPAGLAILLNTYSDDIARHAKDSAAAAPSDPRWLRLTAALDAVSQQRDSYASELYWYTDLEKAKAAARESGKPILSLRLLGKLTEEFSCANSRFFRAILYPDPAVSSFLREHYILHWKSVRPAPLITIDFGDGRKLQRTITGNSIHYVLDSNGRPIDAIPGLYGPTAFLRELSDAERVFRLVASLNGSQRDAALRQYHLSAKQEAAREWQIDIVRSGAVMRADDSIAESNGAATPAVEAAPTAPSKMAVQMPTVRSISDTGPMAAPDKQAEGNASAWQRIARIHQSEMTLNPKIIAVIRSQYRASHPNDQAIQRVILNLQRSLALDSVRNRYLIHSRIHQWFVDGQINQDVDALNERIYARLFLTPSSDPWLGLLTPDTFSGLIDDGVVH